jgi:site-specific recombinase XerC
MPKNRGKRKRVAEGVYQDAIGYEAVVTVGSGKTRQSKAKRFKRGTGMKEMTTWQDVMLGLLRKKKPKTTAGTLGADIREYLKGVSGMTSFEARRADAEAWIPAFGDRDRMTITKSELQQQMNAWHEAEVAGSTLNHRKTALAAVYEALNDEDDPNPVKGVKRYPEADIQPRAIAPEVIQEIIDAMPASKSRAMLRVMAATGHPPERQRKLIPLHVQLEQRRVYLVSRKKGKGTAGRWYGLSLEGVTAYQEFVDQQAWGGVTKESLYTCFMRGVQSANRARAKTNKPLLPPLRPYDLRHSFGTMAYAKSGGDFRAVAELLDCTVETALRYTLGAVPVRMQAVIDALDGPEQPAPKPRKQLKRMAHQSGTAQKSEQNHVG